MTKYNSNSYPQINSTPRRTYSRSKNIPISTSPQSQRSSSVLFPCSILIFLSVCLALMVFFYLIYPIKTTILFLGIDYAPHRSFVGRSDTIVLMRFDSVRPYIGMLSIPRDLWVPIPGVGENRINTAHFFAEANQPGSGPGATIETINQNFGVKAEYFIRIRFDGVREIINAMDGVDIHLDQAMGGYTAGDFHLTGEKALAFARHRQGADDFSRMAQGQLLIKSILEKLMKPINWRFIPAVASSTLSVIDSNLPAWQIPRMGLILVRCGIKNIDSQIIDRNRVTSYTTDQGANVLLPNWELINPLIQQMFNYNVIDTFQSPKK